ncbi:MAG: hypothetical protein AAGC66_04425 [Leifsonia sp.]
MLTDSFPGPSGLTDATELRKDLAGLITRNADGTPRAGVFYRGATSIGSPRTGDMKVDLALFNAALVRTGPLLIQNDGVAQSPSLPIPSSNSIYHVVYVKENETAPPYSDPGGADGPVFGIASSDQGASPDVAQAISRIPSGGLPLVSVLVPSSAVTTSSAGVVVKDIAPFTSAAGAPVPFRTRADMNLWTTAAKGQTALVFADTTPAMNRIWYFDGATWVHSLCGEPFAMAAGANSNVAGQTKAVTFPANRFTVPPIVAMANTGSSVSALNAQAITAAGANMAGYSSTGTAVVTSYLWTAIQMFPDSAAG